MIRRCRSRCARDRSRRGRRTGTAGRPGREAGVQRRARDVARGDVGGQHAQSGMAVTPKRTAPPSRSRCGWERPVPRRRLTCRVAAGHGHPAPRCSPDGHGTPSSGPSDAPADQRGRPCAARAAAPSGPRSCHHRALARARARRPARAPRPARRLGELPRAEPVRQLLHRQVGERGAGAPGDVAGLGSGHTVRSPGWGTARTPAGWGRGDERTSVVVDWFVVLSTISLDRAATSRQVSHDPRSRHSEVRLYSSTRSASRLSLRAHGHVQGGHGRPRRCAAGHGAWRSIRCAGRRRTGAGTA